MADENVARDVRVVTKRCTGCQDFKPASDFSRASARKDGLQSRCKACNARYVLDNKDAIDAWQASYRSERREDARLTSAAWRAANPERSVESKRAYRVNNKDQIASRRADTYAANSDLERFYRRCYYAENRGMVLAANRKWVDENPDQKRAHHRNRKARVKDASGSHNADDIAVLMKTQASKCAHSWCRKSIKDGFHVDHIMPLARGGSNDRRNLQLLCQPCNQRKHAKHPIDFAQQNGLLL